MHKTQHRLILTVLLLATTRAAFSGTTQPATQPSEGPLLNTNGGFEDGDSGYYFARPLQAEIDDEEVYRGQASLRLTGPKSSDEHGDNIAIQGFPVTGVAGKEFVFRVAVKAKDVDPAAPPDVEVTASRSSQPGDDVVLAESRQLVISADTDWKVLEVRLSDVPADVQKMAFRLRVKQKTATTVWFDEIELREVQK